MTTPQHIYYLSFRIAEIDLPNNQTRAIRYSTLVNAFTGEKGISSDWWAETTSYIMFKTTRDLDAVIALVKRCISEKHDIAVVGMPHFQTMVLIGAAKHADALQRLVAFMKKA
jgi:hypothetical protein